MSFTSTPNWNDFIDRFADIFQKSLLIMPQSNGDETKEDLVRQIIKYQFPLPEQPPDGLGPPHIFINRADNPVIRREKIGRDSLDEHGPEKWTLEFYAVSVILEPRGPTFSQQSLYTLTQAIMTTLGKNRRLTNPTGGADPMAYSLTTLDVPYNLKTREASISAHNVIIRPQILVNLRT